MFIKKRCMMTNVISEITLYEFEMFLKEHSIYQNNYNEILKQFEKEKIFYSEYFEFYY
jgi:hypothetical protein